MKFKIIIVFLLCTFFFGCTKDFLDINVDPNNPTSLALNKILPASQYGMASVLGFTNDDRGARGLTEILAVYTHQITVRDDADQYGATGSTFDIDGAWTGMFSTASSQASSDFVGALQNLDALITAAAKDKNLKYLGIGQILKAYAFSQFVDVFGDIPYSEANKFASDGIRYPKFDKSEDIYPQLLTLLDEGIKNLSATGDGINTLVPGSDDLFYQGSISKWIKAANTIKLKLLCQQRLVKDVKNEVAVLLNSGNLISSTTEGFMLNYGSSISPDNRNPGYKDYFTGQKAHYQSPWFYEILKGYNPNILTGVTDPRVPYYFYRQISDTGTPGNPTEYRDGGFVSIYFGSNGKDRDHAADKHMTVLGIYPVGGKYDDDSRKPVDVSSSTGAAPLRLLTYADRLFIEAELIQAGVVSGDAAAVFNSAVKESLALVDYVVSKVGSSAPKLYESAGATAYLAAVKDAFSKGTSEQRMELIMTEKWISSFGYSVDQYTDYRRTGYPVMWDPRKTNGEVQPPINGNPLFPGAQKKVPVQLSRDYPLSLPWQNDELSVNPNAPKQKIPSTFRVFWDKD